jgi:hypothetical protein
MVQRASDKASSSVDAIFFYIFCEVLSSKDWHVSGMISSWGKACNSVVLRKQTCTCFGCHGYGGSGGRAVT